MAEQSLHQTGGETAIKRSKKAWLTSQPQLTLFRDEIQNQEPKN